MKYQSNPTEAIFELKQLFPNGCQIKSFVKNWSNFCYKISSSYEKDDSIDYNETIHILDFYNDDYNKYKNTVNKYE